MQRNTRQRRAILEAFEKARRPLTASEVRDLAREREPRTGLATVYRALGEMRHAGTLVELSLPGEPVRYSPAQRKHRHYFRCDGCRRIFEVDACAGPLIERAPKGFRVRGHEVILYGQCGDCAPRRASRGTGRRKNLRSVRRRSP